MNDQVCLKDIVGCTRESLSKLTFLSFARQFCCNDGTPEAAQARAMARTRAVNGNFKPNDDYEKMQFYYHPDHLGSSSYITNLERRSIAAHRTHSTGKWYSTSGKFSWSILKKCNIWRELA